MGTWIQIHVFGGGRVQTPPTFIEGFHSRRFSMVAPVNGPLQSTRDSHVSVSRTYLQPLQLDVSPGSRFTGTGVTSPVQRKLLGVTVQEFTVPSAGFQRTRSLKATSLAMAIPAQVSPAWVSSDHLLQRRDCPSCMGAFFAISTQANRRLSPSLATLQTPSTTREGFHSSNCAKVKPFCFGYRPTNDSQVCHLVIFNIPHPMQVVG